MSDMFRKYKAKLRKNYLDLHTTYDDKLNNRPLGIKPEDWESFVEHNMDSKIIEQQKKDAKVRKKLDIYHTSGRHGQARMEEKMKRQKKDDDPPITRAEVWIEAHTRKDGSVPSSVSTHMEKQKELLSKQGEVNPHDILNDPLTQVFGVDKQGRAEVLGMSLEFKL